MYYEFISMLYTKIDDTKLELISLVPDYLPESTEKKSLQNSVKKFVRFTLTEGLFLTAIVNRFTELTGHIFVFLCKSCFSVMTYY